MTERKSKLLGAIFCYPIFNFADILTGPSSGRRNGNEKSSEEFSDDEVDAICLIFVVFEENNLVALICKIYIEP